MKYLLILLLTGCSAVFDTQTLAIQSLERQAYAGRQFDKPDVKIAYKFSANVNEDCRKAGVALSNQEEVKACAVFSADPCLVILPYAPMELWVREEQLHCRYGNWHKGAV